MLRNSKDFYLIALAALNVILVTASAALTPYLLARFSLWPLVLAGTILSLVILNLYLTNYQCISHYHIHKPFFQGAGMNRFFSVFNTLALGVPQSLYHVHHQFHHKGNNDKVDPRTGTTVDFASSYRYSNADGVEEGFWPFTLKSVFRAAITPLYVEGVRQGRRTLIHVEFVALFLFWAALIWLSWKNFVFFYLPLWLLGQMLNYAENWLEHHGASHTNRLDDSVSCYNPVYNFLWFNNGYHQEHHYRPSVHWTELPEVRKLMLDESQRRVVPYCHLFNLPYFQRRLSAKQSPAT